MQSLLAWAIHSSRARARNQAACITVAQAGSMHLFIGTWEGEPQNQAQQRQPVVRHGTGQRGENSKDWVRDSHEQMCCFGILHSQHLPRPGRPGPLNWSKYGYWEWRAHIKARPTKTFWPHGSLRSQMAGAGRSTGAKSTLLAPAFNCEDPWARGSFLESWNGKRESLLKEKRVDWELWLTPFMPAS